MDALPMAARRPNPVRSSVLSESTESEGGRSVAHFYLAHAART
jgi:hypothetical protein